MDKKIGKMVQDFTKAGEKKAPIKSIKLKVKFEGTKKKALSKAKKNPIMGMSKNVI